jgi:hypothetical protein
LNVFGCPSTVSVTDELRVDLYPRSLTGWRNVPFAPSGFTPQLARWLATYCAASP